MTKLILWDIDHTLIETRGVGGRVYADAFRAVTGRDLGHMPTLAGRTEPAIFAETLKLHGLDDPGGELFRRFAEQQALGYLDRASELRRTGRALPGAKDALRALSQRDDVVQSVLTGNTRRAARAKLLVFGLDHLLDTEAGAYGTDSETRAGLVGIARERAGKAHGQAFTPANTILIGDTPNDVSAAREAGARIIAVATGRDSISDLARAGAGTVLPDLTRTGDLLDAIDEDDEDKAGTQAR